MTCWLYHGKICGLTKHIKSVVGSRIQLSSTVLSNSPAHFSVRWCSACLCRGKQSCQIKCFKPYVLIYVTCWTMVRNTLTNKFSQAYCIYVYVLYICRQHKQLHEVHYLSGKEKVKKLSARHLYQMILGPIKYYLIIFIYCNHNSIRDSCTFCCGL